MTVRISVALEDLEERIGQWCDTCMLPSLCEWRWMLMFDGKPERVVSYRYCPDCEFRERIGFPG